MNFPCIMNMPLKNSFQHVEAKFESFVGAVLRLYGHPFTFIAALILAITFLFNGMNKYDSTHDFIRDLILCIAFLSSFIIQRAVNKSTTALQIKTDELIASHDKASNDLIKIEEKTGTELQELAEKHKADIEQQSTS
jgi:low affinity Fe/Cu permease